MGALEFGEQGRGEARGGFRAALADFGGEAIRREVGVGFQLLAGLVDAVYVAQPVQQLAGLALAGAGEFKQGAGVLLDIPA